MSYVRVDWGHGDYDYLPNDTECANGEWRNSFLLNHNYYYKRIRFLSELPKGKKCVNYRTNNKGKMIKIEMQAQE
mgnify:CR=1 FL=1